MADEVRYKVVEGSSSGHCCFEASVVDAQRRHPAYGEHHWVCECLDVDDARRVAAALNATADASPTEGVVH